MWQCPVWKLTWEGLIKDINEILPPIQGMERVMMGPCFVYLGLIDEDTTPHTLPSSLALLHAIIWKFIIIELTRKSHNKFHKINENSVVRSAFRRYTTRIRAKLKKARVARARSIHQGYAHSNDTINKRLQPVAVIDDECTEITWHPVVHRWLALAGAEEHAQEHATISPTFTPEW